MDHDRWRRLEDLYRMVLEREPDQRNSFLIEACDGDDDPWGGGRTYVISLRNEEFFPAIPPGGFRTESEIRELPGTRVIESYDVAPGPAQDTYAYSREIVERNLYRIPVPSVVH